MTAVGSFAEFYERRRLAEVEAERAAYSAVTDPAVIAVLDVLAPVRESDGRRSAIFDCGCGAIDPAPEELVALSEDGGDRSLSATPRLAGHKRPPLNLRFWLRAVT